MGTSWISRKGRNLRKRGVDLEKGGMVFIVFYPTEKSVGSYVSVVENVVSSA